MAIETAMGNSFKQELFMALHQFASTGGNSFYAALFTSSAVLNKDTTVYDGVNESVGVGYTAGGQLLTPIDPNLDGDAALVSFQNVVWSNSTIIARGCQIYNQTNGLRNVSTHLFDAEKESSDGDFTLIFPTADKDNAILRLV